MRQARTPYGGLRATRQGVVSLTLIGINAAVWVLILATATGAGWSTRSRCALAGLHDLRRAGSPSLPAWPTAAPGCPVSDGATWCWSRACSRVELPHIGHHGGPVHPLESCPVGCATALPALRPVGSAVYCSESTPTGRIGAILADDPAGDGGTRCAQTETGCGSGSVSTYSRSSAALRSRGGHLGGSVKAWRWPRWSPAAARRRWQAAASGPSR